MKTNILTNIRVLAIMMVCLIVLGVGNAWGTTYTYDFHSCTASSGGAMTYWYSDANCTTHLAKFISGTTNQIISSGGTGTATIYYKDTSIPSTAFTITAGNTAYFLSGATASTAFFWGKTGGNYITLPTYSGEIITKVKVTTSSGVGKSIEVNIYSGDYAASTSYTTTGCTPNGCDNTQYNEFTISDTYQASSLKLQIVTDNKNFQITEIQITTESASPTTYSNYRTLCSTISVTGVEVSPTAKAIVPGETFTITPTVAPADATDKSVSWISGSTAAATVSNGTVTGVAAGTSTITCTTTDGGFTATTDVTVYGVTMQARDEDGGSIAGGGPGAPSRTGASISPAADAGNYVFMEWAISGASLESSASTKANTITNPTAAVTVTAKYYKPRAIVWKVNNVEYTPVSPGSSSVAYNTAWSDLTLPTDPDVGDYCGQKFVGWTTTDLVETALDKDDDATAITALDLMTSGNKSSKTTQKITSNTTTFHAVFADYTTE